MKLLALVCQAIVGLAMVIAGLFLASCSALTPVAATPTVHVSCSWHAAEGAMLEDNDCLVDRSSSDADPTTVGNQIDATTDATVSVPVSP